MEAVRVLDTATLYFAMEAVCSSVPDFPEWKDYRGDPAHCDLLVSYGQSPDKKPPYLQTTADTRPENINSWLVHRGLQPVDFSGLVEGAEHHFSAAVYHLRSDWAATTGAQGADSLQLPLGSYLFGIVGRSGDIYRIPFQNGFIYIYRPPEDVLETDHEIACLTDKLAGDVLFSDLYSKGESQPSLSAMSASGEADLGWVMALRLVNPDSRSNVRSVVLARQQFIIDIQPGYIDITIGTVLGVQLKAVFEETEMVEEQLDFNAVFWLATNEDFLDTFPVGICLVKV
jgi:hypothetical protein